MNSAFRSIPAYLEEGKGKAISQRFVYFINFSN